MASTTLKYDPERSRHHKQLLKGLLLNNVSNSLSSDAKIVESQPGVSTAENYTLRNRYWRRLEFAQTPS